jgi:hypothetical protein
MFREKNVPVAWRDLPIKSQSRVLVLRENSITIDMIYRLEERRVNDQRRGKRRARYIARQFVESNVDARAVQAWIRLVCYCNSVDVRILRIRRRYKRKAGREQEDEVENGTDKRRDTGAIDETRRAFAVISSPATRFWALSLEAPDYSRPCCQVCISTATVMQ